MTEPDTSTHPCPFCAEPILLAARKCKHCGEFLDEVSPKTVADKAKPTVIEATGKGWKAAKLIGWVLILLSIPSCTQAGIQTGLPLLVIGVGLAFVANIGSWWQHG